MNHTIKVLDVRESTEIIRKILSSVWRLNRLNFSAKPSYVLMNLKGQSNQYTQELKHPATTTYASLKNYTVEDIEFWIRQLVKEFKLLEVSADRTHLEISEQGVKFLKNTQEIQLKVCISYGTLGQSNSMKLPKNKTIRKSVRPANSQKSRHARDNSPDIYNVETPRRVSSRRLPTLKVKSQPTSNLKKAETEVERQLREGKLKESALSQEELFSASIPKDTRPRYSNRSLY